MPQQNTEASAESNDWTLVVAGWPKISESDLLKSFRCCYFCLEQTCKEILSSALPRSMDKGDRNTCLAAASAPATNLLSSAMYHAA